MLASICSFTYYSLPCIYKYVIIFTENRGGKRQAMIDRFSCAKTSQISTPFL